MIGPQLRTVQAGPIGWGLILVGGSALGAGVARVTGWPTLGGILVGILLLVWVVVLLDRRAFRRATTIIKLDRPVPELERLVTTLRSRKLAASVSRDPRGIACSGRIHRKVVAAIEDHELDRRKAP